MVPAASVACDVDFRYAARSGRNTLSSTSLPLPRIGLTDASPVQRNLPPCADSALKLELPVRSGRVLKLATVKSIGVKLLS